MADGIDLKEFRKLTRDLKAFKPDKEVKKALKLAGQLVADDARLRVEPHSKSIPLTIKVRVRKTSVSVYAGGPGKPLAGLFADTMLRPEILLERRPEARHEAQLREPLPKRGGPGLDETLGFPAHVLDDMWEDQQRLEAGMRQDVKDNRRRSREGRK